MVSVTELLEKINQLIDSATTLPLSGGRIMINANELSNMIDDVRLHLPQEIRDAQNIVAKRNDVIAQAHKEAESITRKAEEKARQLISEADVSKKARIQANEEITAAQNKARDIRRGATDYSESMLRAAEDVLSEKLTELRQARQNLRAAVKREQDSESVKERLIEERPRLRPSFDVPMDEDTQQSVEDESGEI